MTILLTVIIFIIVTMITSLLLSKNLNVEEIGRVYFLIHAVVLTVISIAFITLKIAGH